MDGRQSSMNSLYGAGWDVSCEAQERARGRGIDMSPETGAALNI